MTVLYEAVCLQFDLLFILFTTVFACLDAILTQLPQLTAKDVVKLIGKLLKRSPFKKQPDQAHQFFAITLWTQTILSFLCATFHDLFDILNIMRSHAFHFIIYLLTNFIFSETWFNHLLSYILLLLVWSYLSNLLIYCIC